MKTAMRRRLARWDSLGQDAPAVSANKATLLKYSAALGAAAAMATSAEAGIIHTTGPVTVSRPDNSTPGTYTAPVSVGLGGDTVNLRVQFGGTDFGGTQNGEATLFGSAGNNVRFAAAQLYDNRDFAVNLAQNTTIGATMANVLDVNNASTAVNFAATPYVQVNRTGDNVGAFQGSANTGFVGLELTIASNVYYGWMKLSVAQLQSPTGMTAIEWAYNDVAGQSILAGDIGSGGGGNEVPEPATAGLALLAAGSAGVLAWRRRRNSTLAA